MTTVETAAPGRHRIARGSATCPDWLASLIARAADAGVVMLTGLAAALVIIVAAAIVFAALITFVGGR